MTKKSTVQKRDQPVAPRAGRANTPGTPKLRAEMISRMRSEMEFFYRHAHLSELLLLKDALLLAESERSSNNPNDDCALGNAIAECFGVNALGPVTPVERRTA